VINDEFAGGCNMFGIGHLIVSAERELREKNGYARDERGSRLRAWLEDHQLLWLTALGVSLALLVMGGNAAA
jgi:hypothetical protein